MQYFKKSQCNLCKYNRTCTKDEQKSASEKSKKDCPYYATKGKVESERAYN